MSIFQEQSEKKTFLIFNLILGVSSRDLEGLIKYKRRNPFDEYGQSELINVYLRSEVEAKALSIWGSIENIQKEQEKRRKEYDQQRQAVFILKKSLKDYHNRVEQLENPFTDKQYVNFNF